MSGQLPPKVLTFAVGDDPIGTQTVHHFGDMLDERAVIAMVVPTTDQIRDTLLVIDRPVLDS